MFVLKPAVGVPVYTRAAVCRLSGWDVQMVSRQRSLCSMSERQQCYWHSLSTVPVWQRLLPGRPW